MEREQLQISLTANNRGFPHWRKFKCNASQGTFKKAEVSVRACLPDGGGGGVLSYGHTVLSFLDLLGPGGVKPGHRGHVVCIYHRHDPVLYTELAEELNDTGTVNIQEPRWRRCCTATPSLP